MKDTRDKNKLLDAETRDDLSDLQEQVTLNTTNIETNIGLINTNTTLSKSNELRLDEFEAEYSGTDIGDMGTLITDDKTTIVGAINEVEQETINLETSQAVQDTKIANIEESLIAGGGGSVDWFNSGEQINTVSILNEDGIADGLQTEIYNASKVTNIQAIADEAMVVAIGAAATAAGMENEIETVNDRVNDLTTRVEEVLVIDNLALVDFIEKETTFDTTQQVKETKILNNLGLITETEPFVGYWDSALPTADVVKQYTDARVQAGIEEIDVSGKVDITMHHDFETLSVDSYFATGWNDHVGSDTQLTLLELKEANVGDTVSMRVGINEDRTGSIQGRYNYVNADGTISYNAVSVVEKMDLTTKEYVDDQLEKIKMPIGSVVISKVAPSYGTWTDLGTIAEGQAIIGGSSSNGVVSAHKHLGGDIIAGYDDQSNWAKYGGVGTSSGYHADGKGTNDRWQPYTDNGRTTGGTSLGSQNKAYGKGLGATDFHLYQRTA